MARVVTLVEAALAIALATAASAGRAKETATEGAPSVQEARQIVLDEKNVGKVFHIRTARNLLTTVEFPEDMLGAPACGDCSSGKDADDDGLFRLDAVGQGRYLTIRPSSTARRMRPGEDEATSVLVRLEHATLTLYVERVERAKADTRVIFVYPNRTAESEYLRVEKAKLEAEAAAKIEAAVSGRFLQAFAEPHHCSRKGARARNDDIVLEVTEMCYFGREVIISFTVENRARAPVEIGSVMVNKGANKREYLSEKTVEFQKVSSGVVALRLPDGDSSSGAYELTVSESAGKRRAVTVTGLEF